VRITIRGRNLSVAQRDADYIERKLRRLERMLDERSDADVELSLEGNRRDAATHIVDVGLHIDGRSLRGKAAAATFQEATDLVIDRLERRTVEHRQRPRDRRRAEGARYHPGGDQSAAATIEGDLDESPVVKVKRFAIEPMFEEDAISRMEELGHTFFIFVDAESERIAVLYRRRDGRYGIIQPVLGGGYGSEG
jgi:putative sigma-54 modulation protein